MQWLTIKKGIFCALRPRLWPLLLRRIAPAIEHIGPLSRFSFRTVVDVGANRGQFAAVARRLFPAARIYSFEPLEGPAAEFGKGWGPAKSRPGFAVWTDDFSNILSTLR